MPLAQVEFGDVWVSIVKAGIMTTGEFEFFDIVHGEEENPGDDAHIVSRDDVINEQRNREVQL